MKLKDIKLRKGMSEEEINTLVGKWILLEDEIYLGVDYKHNWTMNCCKTNKYKDEVEKNGE